MERNLYNSLSKYFSILSSTGSVSNRNTNNLLLLDFIFYVLYEEDIIISQEEYKSLEDLVFILLGSNCLMDYYSYSSAVATNRYSIPPSFRITEEGELRSTEYPFLRDME